MAYVTVPKDLTNVKTKFMGPFTKRQCFCFGLGVLVAVPIYFAVRPLLGTNAFFVLIAVLTPFFLFGMVEKDGLPLETYIVFFIKHKILNPPIRYFESENMYDWLERAVKKEKSRKEAERIANRNNHSKKTATK